MADAAWMNTYFGRKLGFARHAKLKNKVAGPLSVTNPAICRLLGDSDAAVVYMR
jgi:hypothetical protein